MNPEAFYNNAMEVYNFIKSSYPKADTLYEDTILNLVGIYGLNILKENHMIETCAKFGERKLYAI